MTQNQTREGENYRVVFLGLADPSDANIEAFSEELSIRFGIPMEKARRIAKKAPIVIKRNIARSKAERYQRVFERLGGQVRIEVEQTASGREPHPSQESTARVEGFESTSVASQGPVGDTSDSGSQGQDLRRDDDLSKDYDADIAGAYEDSFMPPTHGPSKRPEVAAFQCPQCGQEQPKGIECVRCGIIFEKHKRMVEAKSQAQRDTDRTAEEGEGTQEDFEVKIEPAGFWIRLGAYIVDGVVLTLVTLVLGIPLAFLVGVSAGPMAFASFGPLVYGMALLLPIAYHIYFLGKKGYTPGKGFLGLQVIRQDGTGISYGDAAIRFFSYILSSIPLCLGYLWIGFDRNKEGWHDKIAKTQVIRAEEVSSWRKWVVLVPAILIPIVAIVASIAIPVYVKYSSRADVARAVSEMQIVKSYLEDHYYRYDSYPLTGEYRSFLKNSLGRIPRDPFNRGRPYGYESDGSTFTLWSVGPDGIDNGALIPYDPLLTRGLQKEGDIILYSDEGTDQSGELFGMTPSTR